MTTLDHVLAAARQVHQNHPDMSGFAPWPDDLVSAELSPRHIPAVDLVQAFDEPAQPDMQHLVSAVRDKAHLASWKRTYTEEEVGADFRNRYGYYELFGPTGHFHSTQLRGYIAYWGAGLHYDWHSHEAEEIYLTLAGEGLFKLEDQEARLGSGKTRMHGSWQRHALITESHPILTFVLWRGAGMGDLPQMDAA